MVRPPHGILRDWLGPSGVERLLTYAAEHRERFSPSKVRHGSDGLLDPMQRVSLILKDLGSCRPVLEEAVRASLPDILSATRTQPFEPSRVELELAAHGDGAFFLKHIDTYAGQPALTSRRVISGVYYFHTLPRPFSGGTLRLFGLGSSQTIDIEPENDTLVVFPSWFPHEVLPVSCPSRRFEDSRFAVNCWIHQAV